MGSCQPNVIGIDMTEAEIEIISKKARKMAEGYYAMHKNSEIYWKQDLKAWGNTDEEIFKEFITTAYWYGYMDGVIKDESIC